VKWWKRLSPVEDIHIKMLRGAINGIPGEYTSRGWMLDYSEQIARAVIIDTPLVGNELRALRRGDRFHFKMWVEDKCTEQTFVEYDGAAEVQMVRFYAKRTDAPHFRVQFKLVDGTRSSGQGEK
jgi:hypothetical protein